MWDKVDALAEKLAEITLMKRKNRGRAGQMMEVHDHGIAPTGEMLAA